MPKKKIINAHAHVFTSQFVPPFLAKTIIPWPLYYFIHTRHVVNLAKRYYSYKHALKFPKFKGSDNDQDKDKEWNRIYKLRQEERDSAIRRFNFKNKPYLYYPYKLFVLWLSVVAVIYAITVMASIFGLDETTSKVIEWIKNKMGTYYLYFEICLWLKLLWVGVIMVFINWSRRTIWSLIKGLFPVFNKIVSTQGMELLERYLLMGRFALYKTQQKVAERALHQLPPDSDMVILPMDMEFMGAGTPKLRSDLLKKKDEKIANGWHEDDFKDTYKYQMRELWEFVKTRRENEHEEQYHPFLFLDPRRIKKEGKAFFDYKIMNNKMVLKPCFVKTYMEDRAFSGFKIYPALGYYVFNEHLLPFWRYASENNIPIMTHCVVGVIYYRGKKKKEWNFHPIFKQHYKDRRHSPAEPMLLPQQKNVEFQFNFTHPMNYLCLYEERLLKQVLAKVKDKEIRNLFGYKDSETPLSYNLSNLKICLAHYGGEEEWTKYLETDRDVYTRSIITKPDEGIEFIPEELNDPISWDKINSLWFDTDWYAIITSMLMKYENIYADLSYIISKPSIYPLLNETLQKGTNYEAQKEIYDAETIKNKKASHMQGRNRLRSHILYGTDFYVVRNHNSDKDLFIETKTAIDEESFDLIARENPDNYLSRQ
ncbi:hypothetical protein [Jejuia spongiicola]|uniref:Amidohydrolase n=1 Tax=Jejuia spongiicola TaxID=2942207 RepID=A0ABT0QD19_9FLAO|nr:hypothetical protein [Jejuia spongiicola]MCL6294870.1 hypothetical protein [Jejuia spongiicola]